MKGKLTQIEHRWYVMCIEEGDWETYYPLNPHDEHQIEEDGKRFDNIEARIAAYPDVEFVIEEFWETGMEGVIKVATLVPDYPELEGTMNLCEDVIKKRTGKMTEEEWQATERAQTGNKQETLEEAAERIYPKEKYPTSFETLRKAFISNAKWQQERMYSEVFEWLSSKDYLSDNVDIIKKEFEQFKKKI